MIPKEVPRLEQNASSKLVPRRRPASDITMALLSTSLLLRAVKDYFESKVEGSVSKLETSIVRESVSSAETGDAEDFDSTALASNLETKSWHHQSAYLKPILGLH